MSKIFVSYRRDDSSAFAGRLSDRLVRAFGHRNLFFDIDTIGPGADFVRTIKKALRDIDAFVVIIGRRWATDEAGKRRLDDPNDYVRLEVATALEHDIPVVPILIDGASMPAADELPAELSALATRNAFAFRNASFHADASRLIESLQRRRAYSVVHAWMLSFYSQSLYRDVAQNWTGRGALSLVLLLALAWIPFLWQLQGDIERFVQGEGRWIAESLPRIEVRDGIASTDVQTPYFIRDPDGQLVGIIDMTGQYTPATFRQTGALVLLTPTQLVTREAHGVKVEDLSLIPDFWVDRPRMERWLQLAEEWLIYVLYPVLLIMSFVYRMILAHVLGALGLLYAKVLNLRMRYVSLVRLSAIGMTPAIVLETVRELFALRVPLHGFLGLAIAAAYLFYAIRSNTKARTIG